MQYSKSRMTISEHQVVSNLDKIKELDQSTLTQAAPPHEEARTTSINKPAMQFIKFRTRSLHHLSGTRFKCIKLQRIQIKKEQEVVLKT